MSSTVAEWISAESETTRPLPEKERRFLPGSENCRKENTMPRYFMSDTPLKDLERMMMDPSRQVRDDDQMDGQETEKAPLAEQSGGEELK